MIRVAELKTKTSLPVFCFSFRSRYYNNIAHKLVSSQLIDLFSESMGFNILPFSNLLTACDGLWLVLGEGDWRPAVKVSILSGSYLTYFKKLQFTLIENFLRARSSPSPSWRHAWVIERGCCVDMIIVLPVRMGNVIFVSFVLYVYRSKKHDCFILVKHTLLLLGGTHIKFEIQFDRIYAASNNKIQTL